MNVSVSKVLLGVSVAAYTYCSWDHLSSNKKPDDAPAKPPALTAAMVNHVEVLALGRDAFESIAIDRGDPNAEALAAANATAAANGVANAASMGGGSFDGLALQGIFMTPAGHAALINGIPVAEGEAVVIPGGPKIFARRIGEDFAVIEAWGRQKRLKLDDPPSQAASLPAATPSEAMPSYTAPPRPAAAPSAPAASSNPNPSGHGGGSDPYAGHKTHH